MFPDHPRMNIEITTPQDTADSETESLIVHSNGDVTLDDLLSENECETDVEFATAKGIKSEFLNRRSDTTLMDMEPRAKTRLLSRSHSASDLTIQPDTLSVNGLSSEPPRRNSSGEYPAKFFDSDPSAKPLSNILLQDIELPRHKANHVQRNSLTPTSSSYPSMQYPSPIGWNNVQSSHQDKEDEFSLLLQTTAERVLNKLKSRQQDLGCNLLTGQKSQRRHSHSLQPPVPRKLQPIFRDGKKTPRSESDLKSISSSDSDFGPLSAA